jgi:SNF family Na+-dependent transporter
MSSPERMKFSSRMLMVITPIGVAIGLYEAWHLAGKLVFLMALQILVLAVVAVGIVRVVRREAAQKRSPEP